MAFVTATDLERYMFELVNEERTSRGLSPLVLDQVLNAAADAHSTWMLDNNIFSHSGISGSTPTERMVAEGFDLSGSWRTAENLAVQTEREEEGLFDDVYDLHITLMNSEGHRKNIVTPDLEFIGIGIQTGSFTYDQGTYFSVMVTQNFATTDGQTSPDILDQPDSAPGLAGNDTLITTTDDDLLDGGAGIDTAVYSGPQASYTLQFSQNGTIVTDRRPSQDGTDTLVDIENLQFLDGGFDISARTGAADLPAEDFAAIVELYIAYFDRAPASKGLLYWADRLADGMTLPEIADSFFTQQEIQTTYSAYLNADGSLADTQAFVNAVFNNVLGRDPSGPYWTNELETNPEMTPAIFILAVLNGAKAATGSTLDAAYLADKTDIGVYFSAIKGLSDYDDTIAVMDLYDGSQASIDDAVAATDAIHAAALDPNSGEFLIQLVGIIDDPFAAA